MKDWEFWEPVLPVPYRLLNPAWKKLQMLKVVKCQGEVFEFLLGGGQKLVWYGYNLPFNKSGCNHSASFVEGLAIELPKGGSMS